MKKSCLWLAFLMSLFINELQAQTESTLYFMNSVPQVVEANPAIIPRYKISVGLPAISSVAAIYSNNGFTYNDMTSKVNGVVQADLSKWTASLAEKNYVQLTAQMDLFRFGMRINPKMYVMFSSTMIGYQRTMIPKGLAALFVDGTAPLVNSFTNTSPQLEENAFLSTSFGLAYQVTDRLTLAGRFKYLIGQSNITTDNASLIVQVDDNYHINATGSATVRTSGINNISQGNSSSASDYMKNSGLGLDLGATFKVTDKLTLGASVNDLGFITWRNNTYQYTLDPATANYTFSGFDLNQLVNHNSNYLNQQLDSLKKKFTMKEQAIGAYTTMLPSKFYVSGNYELIPNLKIGALFFGENYRDRFASGVTAALSKNFGRMISTTFSYTVSNRSYNNIGLGVSFNLTPIQLYIIGDNLLRAPASLIVDQNINSYINSSQLLTVRAGLNIVIGWDKGLTKQEEVADKSHNPKAKQSKAKVKTTYGRSPQRKKKR